jgi:hypothetical protein
VANTMFLEEWSKDRVLPFTRLGYSMTKAEGLIGCHSGVLANLTFPLGFPDNPVWLASKLKSNPEYFDFYAYLSYRGREQARKEMLELEGFREAALEAVVTSYCLNTDSVPKLFYLCSDNLDYITTSGNGSYFSIRDLVEYLVETLGWGVCSSHIGRNPNYNTPDHPAHNVQVWILTPPNQLYRLYPNTRFTRNLTKDKLASPDWWNFGRLEQQGIHADSKFMKNEDYTFKKYISWKIKRLKGIPELFKK